MREEGTGVRGPEAPVARGDAGCLQYLLFGVVAFWVLAVGFSVQAGLWSAEQFALIQEENLPVFARPLASWIGTFAMLLPLVPLAFAVRSPRFHAVYRTWAVAAIFVAVAAFLRFVPEEETQLMAFLQTVLALLAAAAVGIWGRVHPRRADTQVRPYPLGVHLGNLLPTLAVAPVVLAPWLALGALGSPLDVVLDVAAALSLGLFAGLLLAVFLFGPMAEAEAQALTPTLSQRERESEALTPVNVPEGAFTLPQRERGNRAGDILFGGFAAGTALAVVGGGFGFAGSQLLLMFALSALGFALAALARSDRGWPEAIVSWRPLALLVGLVAVGPLAFFDPDELTLLLDPRDIPEAAAQATVLSVVLALAAGLGLALLWRPAPGPDRPAQQPGRPAEWLALAGGTWAGAALVYVFLGTPGFYGDQLFVVLRDQADLSAASSVADRPQRAADVYQTLVRHAEASQADLRGALDGLHLGYRPYYLVNGLEVNGGSLAGLYLSRRPEVDRVLRSPHLRPRRVPPNVGNEPAPAQPEWNITSLGADRVWKELGVTGKGIVVGQSDSGVDGTHPALKDGYRGLGTSDDYNWLDPWYGTRSPNDQNGHGTHTLGLAVGRANVGIAPDAQWFGCVILPRNLGNPAYYLNCMQFMLAPYPQSGDPFKGGDPSRGANVTNNSWGCPPIEGCDATVLAPAVRATRAAGIFVATSAGNSGPRCASVLDPLAIYGEAFTVGAVDEQGNVADFSSRGPVQVDGSGRVKPDIAAPGVDILSSYPEGTYARESGTSDAGPHVAGVVALMWSAQPKLIGDVERTEQILRDTARPYQGNRVGCFQGDRPNDAYGYGLVDAYAAVKAAMAMR